MIGKTILHYKITEKLGEGGMGVVYKAEDAKLNRDVAIKFLPRQIAASDQERERFKIEAQAAAALNHPNIATIYAIEEHEDEMFIVMEYIEGRELREIIQIPLGPPLKKGEENQFPAFVKGGQGGLLPISNILDYSSQIAAGLQAAHEKGVTHRDIKSANIMITDKGVVKIMDFGLAKIGGGVQLTKDHSTLGTAAYMSPEQTRGENVDHRTDIWAFGVVFYEMITGQLPFRGDYEQAVMYSIMNEEPEFPDELPAHLQQILQKTLAKELNQRYQNVEDVQADLKTLTGLETLSELKTAKTLAGANRWSPLQRNHFFRYSGIAILILLATLAFFVNRSRSIESIAVMPFINASGNAEIEYLSDGMTETLISSLSRLPKVSVKARSSVFRYKGIEVSLQTLGKELNVQAVLNGRVVQRGDRLTLSLELVNVRTENVIWSEQYNRKQADLVTLQNEIARDVSGKLKTKLSGADKSRVTKNYTENTEAYQLYLKGRFYWNKRTTDAFKQAVEFYNQAIEKDPNYALAYSGLAETYVLYPFYGIAAPKDCMPQAKAAALRALQIDDSLAEAHAALGKYLFFFEFDRAGGEKELRRAIELNPNYATARHWLALDILTLTKRFDEAIHEIKRAEELDPLSLVIIGDAGLILITARRYDEAIAQTKHALTLDQNFPNALYTLGYAFDGKGLYAEAIAEYRKSLALNDDPYAKALLVRSLAKSGRRGEAVKFVEELKSESGKRYVPNYCLAIAYTALGEKDEALFFLEKDIFERSSWVSVIAVEPALDDLRPDPRFKELLKRLNLPE